MKKIAVFPEDVSPTLSMGISLDHVVSMFIPWVGAIIVSLQEQTLKARLYRLGFEGDSPRIKKTRIDNCGTW